MPIVNVKLLEGRSDEQLKNLVSEVTKAVEKTTDANKEAIHVVIEEMKASHYGLLTTALLVLENQINNFL